MTRGSRCIHNNRSDGVRFQGATTSVVFSWRPGRWLFAWLLLVLSVAAQPSAERAHLRHERSCDGLPRALCRWGGIRRRVRRCADLGASGAKVDDRSASRVPPRGRHTTEIDDRPVVHGRVCQASVGSLQPCELLRRLDAGQHGSRREQLQAERGIVWRQGGARRQVVSRWRRDGALAERTAGADAAVQDPPLRGRRASNCCKRRARVRGGGALMQVP